MAANVTGLHQFANDVGPVPLRRLDDSYTALTIALNTLSTFSNFYSDTGATNALTVQTPATQFVSLTDGLKVLVRVANTNTGVATLNVNGLGAQPILNPNGAEMEPGQLLAGALIEFTYNAVRQAWQTPVSSSVITTPFSVMSPTGRTAFAVSAAGAVSMSAPTTVLDDTGAPLFTVNLPPSVPGADQCMVTIGPGSHHTDAGTTLCLWGATNAPYVLDIGAGPQTQPDKWVATFRAFGEDPVVPLNPGFNNGVQIFAGSDASDYALLVEDVLHNQQFFALRGDGSGGLGPAPNQLVWDSAGHFTLTGTATLPPGTLHNLTDVLLSGTIPGQVLTYNGAQWVNAGIPNQAFLNSLSLPNPQSGQVLTWDGSGWIAATPGDVTTIALTSLSDVNIVNPFNRQVLTWDTPSSRWVNAPAASPYLSTLPDVSIASPAQSQVLAWDAVDSKWENVSLPGGEVIALGALMDVVLATPAAGQVLTYDASNQRWVNAALHDIDAPLSVHAAGAIAFSIATSGAIVISARGPNAAALVDMTPDRGTFTGTLTGMTTAVNVQCTWARIGAVVILNFQNASGTSNSTGMTITGLPPYLQPATLATQWMWCGVYNTNGTYMGQVSVNSLTGTLSFRLQDFDDFTASGVKGVLGSTITYLLN